MIFYYQELVIKSNISDKSCNYKKYLTNILNLSLFLYISQKQVQNIIY